MGLTRNGSHSSQAHPRPFPRAGGGQGAAAGYRPEIDGLRAVAVIPVVLFHAGFRMFSGGYIGVDVFFVISGFLITGIILREIEQQRFTIRRFYARRAKRILPALFLVVACCLPFAWAWLLPDDFRSFARSVAAVLLFVSNLHFWSEVGYFAQPSEYKPLLHTWSLAVEEQYYLLFPPALALLMRLGRRAAAGAVAAATLASFALCEVASVMWPTANFFLAPTRAWELLAGSLCAFVPPPSGRGRGHAALAWLGLGLIVAAIVLLSDNTPFPSHFALAPVLGTALLLLYAQGGNAVARLLALPPFVFFGLISYSLYLWHQPLFAFARLRVDEPDRVLMLALAALAVGLATASWWFVERPFRRHRYASGDRRRAVVLGSVAIALFAAFSAYGMAGDGVRGRLVVNRDPQVLAFVASSRRGALPELECGVSIAAGRLQPCFMLGGPGSRRTVALFGDSHAQAFRPALAAAVQGHDVAVLYSADSGCPGLLGVYVLDGTFDSRMCARLAERQLRGAIAAGVDTVLLVARWTLYTEDEAANTPQRNLLAEARAPWWPDRAGSRRAFHRGLARTLAAYRAAGIAVVLVEQVPQQRFAVKRRIGWLRYRPVTAADLPGLIARLAVPAERDERLQGWNRAVLRRAAAEGVRAVSFAPAFAAGDRYRWGDARSAWYTDETHLSVVGAERLGPRLALELGLREP